MTQQNTTPRKADRARKEPARPYTIKVNPDTGLVTGSTSAPAAPSHYIELCCELDVQIGELRSKVAQMTLRAQPLCTPSPMEATPPERDKVDESASPLVMELDGLQHRLRMLYYELDALDSMLIV